MVVTDQRTSDSQRAKLVDDLTEAFEFWLKDSGKGVPATLAQQIALIDGNQLAAYLREHRLRLPAKLREPLGLKDTPGLKSWEQWGSELEQERGLPTFVPDSARRSMGEAIRRHVGQNRVVRLVGPPGVGKTRAVYEALSALPDPSAMVVYTSNPDRDVLMGGQDETSQWEAAKRVIAGPKRDYGGDHSKWDREAEIKAKCLLVVILAGHRNQGCGSGWGLNCCRSSMSRTIGSWSSKPRRSASIAASCASRTLVDTTGT